MELFRNDAEWNRFKEILLSWKGTPYRHLTMVKGRGADCTLFIAACLKEYGAITKVEYEHYSKDWFVHTNNEVILGHLHYHVCNNLNKGYELVEKETTDEIIRGDWLTFSTTKTNVSNHASIYLGPTENKMIHSIVGRGVSLFHYGRFWREKLTHIYRLERK